MMMRWILALLVCAACSQPATAIAEAEPATPSVPRPGEAPTPEPAPVAQAPAPRTQTAGSLQVLEIVLGDAPDPEAPLPMIVAIHGLGDQPDNFAHLFDAFTEPARLVLPQGIDETPEGGYSWFPLRARDPDVEALAQGIAHAADRLAEAIAIVKRDRPTVGDPIVVGFSQGGMLAFALAVHHPEVVGSALPIGGWLPPPLLPSQRTAGVTHPPIHAFHGTEDRAVRYEPTKLSIDALGKIGIVVELHTYEGVGHVITPEIQRDVTDAIIDAMHRARRAPN